MEVEILAKARVPIPDHKSQRADDPNFHLNFSPAELGIQSLYPNTRINWHPAVKSWYAMTEDIKIAEIKRIVASSDKFLSHQQTT